MSNDLGRLGDVPAMLRLLHPLNGGARDNVEDRRRLVADVCRLIGEQVNGRPAARAPRGPTPKELEGLSPRELQTLRSLLGGDSEKQAAAKLGVSHHTVHVYVKALYRKYGVSSRGELLAKWVEKSARVGD